MNENSPTWARPADTVSATRSGCPNRSTNPNLNSPLPTTIRISTATIAMGIASNEAGSRSIPTDTKNSTAKASRSGIESAAAWWLMSDSPTTAPARNAPSANDTPNTDADT